MNRKAEPNVSEEVKLDSLTVRKDFNPQIKVSWMPPAITHTTMDSTI